jgi:hypothetical protein
VRAFLKSLPGVRTLVKNKTVEEQIQTYGPAARARLIAAFKKAGVEYPPERTSMVAVKASELLYVYAATSNGPYRFVRSYPILGASGHLGPKLRFGDMQVPEGIYNLALEPNTPYHLALRLNYPNDYDLQHAQEEGRNPGSDILVHGTTGSVGCLAMGDQCSEDLFVLAHDTKDKNITLVLCPVDLRITKPPQPGPNDPVWLGDLYARIRTQLSEFPVLEPSATATSAEVPSKNP